MKPFNFLVLCLALMFCFSCKRKTVVSTPKKVATNQIILISKNAPKDYSHFLIQDSIGKKITDSSGPKAIWRKNGFTYLDHMKNVQTWLPKPYISDTLKIECYDDYLEISTNNFFTSIKETFLLKNGDTVIVRYKNNIPKAKITNREVNDVELNYNSYRLKTLFNNKYSSHYLVFGSLFLIEDMAEYDNKSIDYYSLAKEDYTKEIQLLDSLVNYNIISQTNYSYRLDALNTLMEKHKKIRNVKNWLEINRSFKNKENLEKAYEFDLSHTDSLMKFSFFREYLNQISQYNLNYIEENNGSYGGYFIDSRLRFDSILKDSRFNQTAKNFLLFNAYNDIGINFKVKDKEKYFKKLQENTTNIEKLNELKKEYNLDFNKSDELVLTDIKNDTLIYRNLLKNNKGKWLFIDFWASWCKPCRLTMPASNRLKKKFKQENVEFIYLSLNDKKVNWKKAIQLDSIFDSQNYFVENGNVSQVLEDLGIESIPHYLIYNPNGILVNGYANRPGQGAQQQLENLMLEANNNN